MPDTRFTLIGKVCVWAVRATDSELRKVLKAGGWKGLPIRKSHENPHITYIYDKFLTEGPCSKLSHKLLHTEYVKRGQ